jgi:hypothetical protein
MKVAILGFFEDVTIRMGDRYCCLGTRRVPYEPGRKLGAEGIREVTFTEPLTLRRGAGKVIEYKASQKKPIVAQTSLQMINGRTEPRETAMEGPYYDTDTKTIHRIPGFAPGYGWMAVNS